MNKSRHSICYLHPTACLHIKESRKRPNIRIFGVSFALFFPDIDHLATISFCKFVQYSSIPWLANVEPTPFAQHPFFPCFPELCFLIPACCICLLWLFSPSCTDKSLDGALIFDIVSCLFASVTNYKDTRIQVYLQSVILNSKTASQLAVTGATDGRYS